MAQINKRRILSAIIFLLLRRRTRRRSKRWVNRKAWSKSWILRRRSHGIFYNLLNELSTEDEAMYRQYMRMSPQSFLEIADVVKPFIQRKHTKMRPCIRPQQRLAITLRFLATGESFQSLSFAYRVGRSTISTIVKETCEALYKALKDEHLKMPNTEDEWNRISEAFEKQWNYPFCLGALDGKHVNIKQPDGSGSQYFNYKNFFSIILLALVDANYRFLYVDVGAPGRCGDAGVFGESTLKKALDTNQLNLPPPACLKNTNTLCNYHIIGDDAFPMSTHIMKPYPHRNLEKTTRVFNYRFSRARRVVENAFGILANRFRVFLTPISLAPEHVENIILAACCLHNYLIEKQPQFYLGDVLDDQQNIRDTFHSLNSTTKRNSTVSAKGQRDALRLYFSSPEGSVPWQDGMVE